MLRSFLVPSKGPGSAQPAKKKKKKKKSYKMEYNSDQSTDDQSGDEGSNFSEEYDPPVDRDEGSREAPSASGGDEVGFKANLCHLHVIYIRSLQSIHRNNHCIIFLFDWPDSGSQLTLALDS